MIARSIRAPLVLAGPERDEEPNEPETRAQRTANRSHHCRKPGPRNLYRMDARNASQSHSPRGASRDTRSGSDRLAEQAMEACTGFAAVEHGPHRNASVERIDHCRKTATREGAAEFDEFDAFGNQILGRRRRITYGGDTPADEHTLC